MSTLWQPSSRASTRRPSAWCHPTCASSASCTGRAAREGDGGVLARRQFGFRASINPGSLQTHQGCAPNEPDNRWCRSNRHDVSRRRKTNMDRHRTRALLPRRQPEERRWCDRPEAMCVLVTSPLTPSPVANRARSMTTSPLVSSSPGHPADRNPGRRTLAGYLKRGTNHTVRRPARRGEAAPRQGPGDGGLRPHILLVVRTPQPGIPSPVRRSAGRLLGRVVLLPGPTQSQVCSPTDGLLAAVRG